MRIRAVSAFFWLLMSGFLSVWPTGLHANATARICDNAAALASRAHGVPLDVLHAITRTETGRHRQGALKPWPWTVNMEGAGHWFETEDAARAYVFRHFKRGARSFDVGCFQINYKWHGNAFRSIDEMFDPVANADYAARFLSELYVEFGDWTKAAGAYHSRTRKYADIYEARFDRIRGKSGPLRGDSGAKLPLTTTNRRASFGPPQPLALGAQLTGGPLIGSGDTRLGSLVPLAGTAAPRSLVFLE